MNGSGDVGRLPYRAPWSISEESGEVCVYVGTDRLSYGQFGYSRNVRAQAFPWSIARLVGPEYLRDAGVDSLVVAVARPS